MARRRQGRKLTDRHGAVVVSRDQPARIIPAACDPDQRHSSPQSMATAEGGAGESECRIVCECYQYVADMPHKKPSCTRITRSSSYTTPLLNRPAHSKATLGDHSFSLLVLSGTLFQMMSGVPHHCHHLSLVLRHTCFVQFTKTELVL